MREFTDLQLQDEMKRYLPEHPRYKAANILLEERRLAKEEEAEKKRRETIHQAERHHSERQRLARIAALISALGALASWSAFAMGRLLPQPQSSALEQRVKVLEERLVAATSSKKGQVPVPAKLTPAPMHSDESVSSQKVDP